MFGWIKDAWMTRRLEQSTRLEALRIVEQGVKEAGGFFGGVYNQLYQDLDLISDQNLFGMHTLAPNIMMAYPRRVPLNQARRISRQMVRANAHAKNIMCQIVNFTVGSGFGVKIQDEQAREEWSKRAEQIKWDQRARETVRRIPRDGEVIWRRFGDSFRFVEPEDLSTPRTGSEGPEGPISDGIEHARDDVETVFAYWIKDERVLADDVRYLKDPYADMNDVRGFPMIFEGRADLDQYEQWLKFRLAMNKIRAAFAFIRRDKRARQTQTQSLVSAVRDGVFVRGGGQQTPFTFLPPGIGLYANEQTEYEFPKQNIGAADAEADGRAASLMIAARYQLPEFMVTGDASNANFASTLVAENPGVQAMKSWQEYVASYFRDLVRWVLDRPDLEVDFSWPSMIARNELQEAQSNQIKFGAGVISKATWQERDRLDPEQESERIRQEDEEAQMEQPEPQPKPLPDDLGPNAQPQPDRQGPGKPQETPPPTPTI